MTTTLDYAQLFETRYRPSRRIRRLLALALLAALFVICPRLALSIWNER